MGNLNDFIDSVAKECIEKKIRLVKKEMDLVDCKELYLDVLSELQEEKRRLQSNSK